MADDEGREPPEFASPSGARKRPRDERKWKKNVAKHNRNLGLHYTSAYTGKEVSARNVGPPCGCSMKCFDIVGQDNINLIFNDFWKSGKWEVQTAYIQKHTTTNAVKRRRCKDPEKQRSCTRAYHVSINNIQINVCKTAFAHIHGISKPRVDRALNSRTASDVLIPDQRGRSGTHGKVADERTAKIKEHINGFPTLTNHYSRKSSPDVRYLDTEVYSRRQMHDLYKEWLDNKYPAEVPCTWHYYDDVMKAHFPHLKLYKPRQDTCKTCDMYAIKVKDPAITADNRKTIDIRHALHLAKAEQGYRLPKKLAGDTPDTTMVVCMDLQQALPTPKVSTGIAFYLRKMWTYNFNVHDYKTGKGHMFVWDEVTAKRGAVEICSCLNKFVDTFVPPEVTDLYIFSDNCSGQNKNLTLLLFYLTMIHSGRFKNIHHIYFRAGHTYMAADRDFALIEKNMRKMNYVFTPDEHLEIIKNTRRARGDNNNSNPFEVVRMNQADFLDYDCLKKVCTRRNPNNTRFIDACYFTLSHTKPSGYSCDSNYATLDLGSGEHVRLARGLGVRADKAFNLGRCDIPQKYTELIPLAKPKLQDLKVLVNELVPPFIRRRYWDKILGQTTADPEANPDSDAEALDDPDPNPWDINHEDEDLGDRGFFDYE